MGIPLSVECHLLLLELSTVYNIQGFSYIRKLHSVAITADDVQFQMKLFFFTTKLTSCKKKKTILLMKTTIREGTIMLYSSACNFLLIDWGLSISFFMHFCVKPLWRLLRCFYHICFRVFQKKNKSSRPSMHQYIQAH